MPIYRITAPLIEYCKKLQNVKITIRNAQVAGSSPIASSIEIDPSDGSASRLTGVFVPTSRPAYFAKIVVFFAVFPW